jgi:Tfp pilus assembly protein PilV
MIPYARQRRGMSMIEVLMALGLLATTVLAILGMFPALARTNKNTMESSSHLYAAQEMLGKLTGANQTVSTSYVTDYPFGSAINGYRRYRGISDPYDATCQTIEVEVTWVEDGRTRSILLYGLVCP